MLDLCNHAPQKHEAMRGFLTENGMKCSLRGWLIWGKMPSNDGVCCTKIGEESCGDGRKMMTGIAKKFSGYNL